MWFSHFVGVGRHRSKEAECFAFGHTSRKGLSAQVWVLQDIPGGSVIKNPLPVQEIQVRSFGREDPLEEGMAAPSSILAWRIPWTEEPGGLPSTGSEIIYLNNKK